MPTTLETEVASIRQEINNIRKDYERFVQAKKSSTSVVSKIDNSKKAEEDAAKKKNAEEEAAKKKKVDEEAAKKKKAGEETAKKKAEEETAKKSSGATVASTAVKSSSKPTPAPTSSSASSSTVSSASPARFGGSAQCFVCSKAVYPQEKLTVQNKTLHKGCYKCSSCSRVLTPSIESYCNDKLYCVTHNPGGLGRK